MKTASGGLPGNGEPLNEHAELYEIKLTAVKPLILMVDDREENLTALERVLRDMDVDLLKATSGNEALRLTLHNDFALALLDIQMPGMDGYELAELLRADEKTADLPFIFISAIYTDHINVFKGYEKGAFSYITKPFEPEILINKVKLFVDKFKQEQALKQTHQILEQLVRERTIDLERSNRELESFAYVASHDLQEPLRSITSFLQLLKRRNEGSLDETSAKYIEVVVDSALRMKKLIEALLSYSRVGSKTVEFRPVNCNELFQRVLTDVRMRILEKNAEIQCGDLPIVTADGFQCHMLFQNLLSNALKFVPLDRKPQVEISARPAGKFWTFTMRDNGIGIESKFFDRVFVIFQRLHTRTEYEGTGIGLSICKKIVERHGGRIWLESEPGTGTAVHFNLPV